MMCVCASAFVMHSMLGQIFLGQKGEEEIGGIGKASDTS